MKEETLLLNVHRNRKDCKGIIQTAVCLQIRFPRLNKEITRRIQTSS